MMILAEDNDLLTLPLSPFGVWFSTTLPVWVFNVPLWPVSKHLKHSNFVSSEYPFEVSTATPNLRGKQGCLTDLGTDPRSLLSQSNRMTKGHSSFSHLSPDCYHGSVVHMFLRTEMR